MPRPTHIAARNTAWFGVATLAVMLLAFIFFESGQMPIAFTVRLYGPTAALLALPLLYVAIALTRGPSRHALALGVAYPAVTLVLFWRNVSSTYSSGSEGAMGVLFAFMFFWASKPWMIFLLAFVPTMLRLLVVSCEQRHWSAIRVHLARRRSRWRSGLPRLFVGDP